MKTQLQILVVITLALSTLNLQRSTAFAQGSLTPPGAPTPTMKSLTQIEPRTPISAAPFTIATSGSYYLTANLTVSSGNAITITANNVTLDLNGFTIASTAGNATTDKAILLSGGRMNIAIYNGHISSGVTNTAAGVFSGGGFSDGISYSGTPHNVRVKDVSVAGVLYFGIVLGVGNSTVVEACTVNVAGSYGIYADSVSDSTALNCGSYGIVADTAHNCKGYAVGNSYGLYVTTANNCFGYSSGGTGLKATGVATGCYGYSSTGDGLVATTANNCYGSSSVGGYGQYGLYAETANNCYGTSSGIGTGLVATTANNCYGTSSGSGTGLFATAVATGCYGYSYGGNGLSAFIASVCHGATGIGTALTFTHNVNSF